MGSKFQNAVVCTKAHYNRHLIGSYLRSANQASSFNACNVETSFTASNWQAITRLGFIKNLPELKQNWRHGMICLIYCIYTILIA